MLDFAKRTVRGVFRKMGFDIVRDGLERPANVLAEAHPDFDDSTNRICAEVKPYTMTSKERVFALRQSVEYVIKHNIPGDIVECGVWKGGSMMVVARTLMENGTTRKLHLFDTFEGMTAPTEVDKNFRGLLAADRIEIVRKETNLPASYSPLDEVKQNLKLTGYDEGQIVFVKGKVEDTIPANSPDRIALLRLDTDWYESTRHELVHLYPRLSVGGVLIIDDYGHWTGARKAVDEYIKDHHLKVLLARIDYSARMCVKLEP